MAAPKVELYRGRWPTQPAANASLPANDFLSVDEVEATERVRVPEAALKELIERTAFAMRRSKTADVPRGA